MIAAPIITALAPWFGSKRTLAPAIIEALGPHRAYWEPFCGSMSVLLSKPPCTMETVNDLHGQLVNLARVVQDPKLGPMLYRSLRRILFAEATFDELRSISLRPMEPEEPNLEAALVYFVCSWMGRNGSAGTANYNNHFCRRFTKNGGSATKRWAGAVDSIPAWRRRLRNVTILRCDAFDLLARIEDADGVAIYLDPPYLAKGSKYAHDFTAPDHQRLADAVARFKRTRVIVSYYDDPRLDALYPAERWERRRIEVNKAMANSQIGGESKGERGVRVVEVLLINQTAGGLLT